MLLPTLGLAIISPLSYFQMIPLWVILCFSFWALTGEKEYQFLDKFRTLPFFQTRWIRAQTGVHWEISSLLPKKKRHGSKQTKATELGSLTPIEDFSDLVCYGQIELQGYQVGFYLLEDRRRQLQFVFRWSVQGPHAELSNSEADILLEKWNTGIKEFIPTETVTFEQESLAQDYKAQITLDKQTKNIDHVLLKALIYSQKVRIRQLRDKGRRRIQRSIITATYTPTQAVSSQDRDLISKGILWLNRFWENFQGKRESLDHERLQKMVGLAFREGFLRWHSIFTSIMELAVQPLSAEELWQRDYAEFHQQEAPLLPQRLLLNGNGLQVEADDSFLHASTVLFQGEYGISSVPTNHPEWVYFPTSRTYSGVLQLGKPKRFSSARNKVRYLWNVLSWEQTGDCRAVVQFSSTNQKVSEFELERLTRYSNKVSEQAIQNQDVAVGADQRADDATQARRALQDGDKIVHVAAGLFLYRKNPQTLERDFANLNDYFAGSDTYREPNITPRLWLQTLPYVKEGFLHLPTDRRDTYLSRDAVGLLPLTSTHPVNDKGVELLALESGTPIHLDAFSPDHHLRLAIFGQSRSGKSLFQSEWVVQACLHGTPVIGFDFPRPDGSSTYKDLTERLSELGFNACYYDILSKSNNLLDLPDYSGKPDARERRRQIIEFQIDATVTIAIGDVDNSLLEQEVRSLVTQSLNDFHAQPAIQERYRQANAAGIGTSEWENPPTYHDYCAFLETWLEHHLEHDAAIVSNMQKEAASLLIEQLRSCLRGKLGTAIATPSSFPPETDTLILALTNLSSNYEASVMALVGYACLMRRALESEVSFFLTDESPILFQFPAISKRIGQLCANGAKWGVRVILSGQDAGTIYHSAAGEQIFSLLNVVMIGHIEHRAKDSFVEALKIDKEKLDYCANKGFKPSPSELRSHWLLSVDGNYTQCGYYPSELLLSLTANNLDESRARERVMAQYEDPVEGAIAFMQLYSEARRSGKPMSEIAPQSRLLKQGEDTYAN